MMNRYAFGLALITAALSSSGPWTSSLYGGARSVLPSASEAHALLHSTTRHREWVNVGTGASPMLAFIVFPERLDKAPVILVDVKNEQTNVRARAVADQLAAEGFVALVPDVVTEAGVTAARAFARQLPAANGTTAWLKLDFENARADIVSEPKGGSIVSLRATPANWPRIVGHLSQLTHSVRADTPIDPRRRASMDEHAAHLGHPVELAAQNQTSGATSSRMTPGLGDKRPNLPASYYTATATLARSALKKEWVDIPLGDVKLRTWVVYPEGNGPAGVVIVMQHGVGLDDWMRSVADQIAADGFIAVAPDVWSGTGPNGGNRDSFRFDDEAMRAAARITPDETQRRYKAAREWALKLPRANGKTGSIGFCAGGSNSFRFAAEVPELNAAVVYYGAGPAEDVVKSINAPVLGFYGENDARVTASVAPTREMMTRLGKSYEAHVYPKVTHSFVYFQDLSVNRDAVADAWPRTIAFFKRQLT